MVRNMGLPGRFEHPESSELRSCGTGAGSAGSNRDFYQLGISTGDREHSACHPETAPRASAVLSWKSETPAAARCLARADARRNLKALS